MKTCPICSLKTYQVFPMMVESDVICPIHGEIKKDEFNRSPEFYQFISDVNDLKQLEFSMLLFQDEEQLENYKKTLIDQGLTDIDDIIQKKMEKLIGTVNMTMIIQLKRAIERYSKSIGYDVGSLAKEKKRIIDKSRIKHPLTEDEIEIFSLIHDLRGIFIHITRKKGREYNPTLIDAIIKDFEEGDLSFLREPVIFRDFVIFDPIFAKGLTIDEIRMELRSRPTKNMDKTTATTLTNYIIEVARKIILEIDKDIHP